MQILFYCKSFSFCFCLFSKLKMDFYLKFLAIIFQLPLKEKSGKMHVGSIKKKYVVNKHFVHNCTSELKAKGYK